MKNLSSKGGLKLQYKIKLFLSLLLFSATILEYIRIDWA